MSNTNMYYFNLNKNYKSMYNFDIIEKTFKHKCQNIDKERICFILNTPEQYEYIKNLKQQFNYISAPDVNTYF